MYSITAARITSGDELKQRNGLAGLALDLQLIPPAYSTPLQLVLSD
jgi:hypothetical protein